MYIQNRSTTENTGSIARQCNFSPVQLLVLAMMTTSKKNMHENTIIKTGQQRKTLVSLLTMQFFMLNCFCYQWRLVSASNSNWTEEKLHCEQWNQYFLLLNIFLKFENGIFKFDFETVYIQHHSCLLACFKALYAYLHILLHNLISH